MLWPVLATQGGCLASSIGQPAFCYTPHGLLRPLLLLSPRPLLRLLLRVFLCPLLSRGSHELQAALQGHRQDVVGKALRSPAPAAAGAGGARLQLACSCRLQQHPASRCVRGKTATSTCEHQQRVALMRLVCTGWWWR